MKQEKTGSARMAEKNKWTPLVIVLAAVAVLAAVGLIVYAIGLSGRTDPSLFTVSDGVLTGYSGDERTVILPDGVVVVSERAFMDHTEIEKVVFPASLTTLRNGAFYGCSSLKEIRFDKALSFIGDAAFGECTSLTTFEIPASVQYIHSEALYACGNLTEITGAEGNESYQSRDGVLYTADGKVLLIYPAGRTDESFSVPADTETIAMGAFLDNTHLRRVDLGGVKEIGEAAFSSCTALETLTVPGSVSTVYPEAFSGCTALAELTLEEGVQVLGVAAFQSCTSLTRVELPESMQEIGQACFGSCTALSYVSFPAEMEGIYETAFDDCPELKIYGYPGSPAQAFADAYGIPFRVLD